MSDPLITNPNPPRRYVDTGKACVHCGERWSLYLCICGQGACRYCAEHGICELPALVGSALLAQRRRLEVVDAAGKLPS